VSNGELYTTLRHRAMVLRDIGGYDLGRAEMNPVIFEEFIEAAMDAQLPPVMWEPFAGHTGRSRTQNFATDAGVKLISYDLEPSDERVKKADSTEVGPGEEVGGVIFHPPYFGSVEQSDQDGELSWSLDFDAYSKSLKKTVDFATVNLVDNGLVCAVGRDYRHAGDLVSLARLYMDLFGDMNVHLIEVWLSEPDVVLIFRKTK
jgi:hypothetical protein